jgi:hypothetical protein
MTTLGLTHLDQLVFQAAGRLTRRHCEVKGLAHTYLGKPYCWPPLRLVIFHDILKNQKIGHFRYRTHQCRDRSSISRPRSVIYSGAKSVFLQTNR